MKIPSSLKDSKEGFFNGVGGFCWGQKCELAILEGRQTALKYIQTLERFLLPFVDQELGPSWVFQQDGTSIHREHVVKDCFNEEDIVVLGWPAKSPDLNPIENLWGILARKVYENRRQFKGVAKLRECVLAYWDSIAEQTLHNLVGSMQRRCFEVLKDNWKATKY